jgi:hypothetical protein
MKKASIVVSDFYKNNRLFDINDPISNKDNCLYGLYHLKKELSEQNIDLSTHDINTIPDSEIVIFSDMPKAIPPKASGQRFYLLAVESVAVHPINFQLKRYKYFDKIFTWKDDIIDGDKIVKINYSFLFPVDLGFSIKNKKKLVCLVANRKRSPHKSELYTERIKVINWFENNYPDEFDLFGAGWEKLHARNFADKIVKRLKYKQVVKTKPYTCYKGTASPKIPILRNYKFNICYENIRDIPGYITEKIFDCFFAGCVPVYWGADNVTDHIPKECFVDKRVFKTYEELYHYMKNMSDDDYKKYLDNIKSFLKSDKAYPFSSECFSKTISEAMSM